MKYKSLFVVVVFACLSTSLIVFSSASNSGAIDGLKLCYNVVIPSLFPFTVFSLIIFESGFFDRLNINKNFEELFIFFLSSLGGFPVGAKIINNAYKRKSLSKKNAELMLGYCVSSGPSFIILSLGSQILNNKTLGYILFISNLTANLIIMIAVSRLKGKNIALIKSKTDTKPFSEIFVNSTYDATVSIISICAYVTLFSTIISVINRMLGENQIKKTLLPLLEITNGVTLTDNIYYIAFLLGFGGICVHIQILTMCSDLKPNYLKFFAFRTFHGTLLVIITKLFLYLFKIDVSALSDNNKLTYMFSETSTVFGVCLIMLSIAFILSVNKKNNII